MFKSSLLSSVVALALVFASPASGASPQAGGVVISTQTFPQRNPDGSVTIKLFTVLRMPDGTTKTKTEDLPASLTHNASGQLVASSVPPSAPMLAPDLAMPGPVQGEKIADLIALRGRPISVAEGPRKSIYRWADIEVTVAAGLVTEWRQRNLEVERNNNADRARAAADRQRLLQEQQQASAAYVPPQAAPAPAWNANGYTPRSGPTKEERMAQIRLEIEDCRRTGEIYFQEISKPFNARRVSPAQRDLAEAQLTRLEQELADLERQ